MKIFKNPQSVQTSFALIITCILLASYVNFSDAQQAEDKGVAPEVAFLAAGIENAASKIKCAQAEVTYYTFNPGEFAKHTIGDKAPAVMTKDYEHTDEARWYYKAPKLGMSVYSTAQHPQDAHLYRMITDGKTARVLYQVVRRDKKTTTEDHLQSDGGVLRADQILFEGMWKRYISLDLRSYITHQGVSINPSTSQYLRKSNAQFKGEEEVFGVRCSKVEVQTQTPSARRLVFWFDTTHGFLLRKFQQFAQEEGKESLLSEWIMPEVLEDNGIWVPKSVELIYYWGILFGIEGKPFVERFTVKSFKANCDTPDEVFEMPWPLDTSVKDEITGKRFVVAAQQPLAPDAAQLPLAEDDPNNEIGAAKPLVKVGGIAPDFIATDMNGKTWKLSELKGQKNVLLTFFPKCFTGGCANHLSSLRDHQAEFDALDTQILAVSVDPAEGERGQKAFAQQWQLGFPLIPDTQRTLSKLFGAAQTDKQLSARMSVFINKNGVVRWIDTDVHVASHGADVLAKIGGFGLNQ